MLQLKLRQPALIHAIGLILADCIVGRERDRADAGQNEQKCRSKHIAPAAQTTTAAGDRGWRVAGFAGARRLKLLEQRACRRASALELSQSLLERFDASALILQIAPQA